MVAAAFELASTTFLEPDFDAIPGELRALPRWVVWKGQKVPYRADMVDGKASVSDPNSWATFDRACTAYEEGGYHGVGFVLNGDGIVGVDLDKCVSDKPDPAALHILSRIGCRYIEFSPSGRGLRGFGRGPSMPGRRGVVDGVAVELYSSGRYLTVTGHALASGPIVRLPGFTEVANLIRDTDLQKSTEDDRSHPPPPSVAPLLSSVGVPAYTLPTDEGQRNRALFSLARFVKGTRPDASREELRAIVQAWHTAALPAIGTKEFGVTWTDFLRGWARVTQPHGQVMNSIVSLRRSHLAC